jgi:hypothetical protein
LNYFSLCEKQGFYAGARSFEMSSEKRNNNTYIIVMNDFVSLLSHCKKTQNLPSVLCKARHAKKERERERERERYQK